MTAPWRVSDESPPPLANRVIGHSELFRHFDVVHARRALEHDLGSLSHGLGRFPPAPVPLKNLTLVIAENQFHLGPSHSCHRRLPECGLRQSYERIRASAN